MTRLEPVPRVMQSFRAPRPTTNPYITQLDRALATTPGLRHERFSWLGALLGRYDAFHWHWPEGKLEGTRWWKAAGKYALTLAIVLRHRFSRRIAVVRTVHNVELPDVNAPRRWLLTYIDRHTDHRIVLNSTTRVPEGSPATLIPHGHYRDWYAPQERHQRIPGRLATFGAVRRYKSVDVLLDAYAKAVATRADLSLEIGGRPSSAEIEQDVRARTAELPGVQLSLEFLSDAELVRLTTSAELIVLAYRFMHNSGSVLAALSLSRPVLVPRNPVNEELAAEVGSDWVLMFDDELDAADVMAALDRAAALPDDATPDLSQRDWDRAGREHRAAFSRAIAAKRGLSTRSEDGTS
ncbi:glycosyl transferase [Aeromicrobium duanguangcaii]|uniref:glycosyl transferase n=1 Tax=Aeromicrobium duanguangcaii TaxID=2968086 RepID=UPI002016E312|nr:glycosyl transferase [Aeromicrobium duanguangcaii]MCL3839196.1 glycosyl transferase [Aeromicrobium duanguangcaii]